MQTILINIKPSVPTSDLKSSDFVLPESVCFISPCSSSSLLIDGVLPFDNERTAGGATTKSNKEKINVFPKLKAYISLKKEAWWLSFCSKMANQKHLLQGKDRGLNKLITLSCGVGDLSELPALVQEQSEFFNTSVLKKTKKI